MDAKYESMTQCELCSNSDAKAVDEQGHIVQCKRCGLRFVSPRPTQEYISQNYDWCCENWPEWGKVTPQEELLREMRFNFLNRFIQSGKILDVGAGLGQFLSRAKKTNSWQCFGTETSLYAVEFAKKEFGIELVPGQLEDLGFPHNSFDAVCFWHVLEHLPYPSRAIKETRRILKDDGFLFIAAPNDSWLGRPHFFKNAFRKTINRLPFKHKLKLKKMYPEINEMGNVHLFYFTPTTLRKLLAKCGFRIKMNSIDYDYGKSTPKIERKYKFDLLFCNLLGVNLGNAILVAAQKAKKIT